MKIAIDVTSLLLPSAGVKTYLHHWLHSLLNAAPGRGDILLTYPRGVAIAPLLDHQHPAGTEQSAAALLRLVRFANIRQNPMINLLVAGADLFHCSQHTANLPVRKAVTATIFDLSCWTTPQYHTPANVAASRRYGEKILKAASGLIAISQHTLDDAVEILGIPKDRIRVIYPGVADTFFSVAPDSVSRVRAHYRLNSPYLLFVGCIEPRKNVPALIQAYLRLPGTLRSGLELIVSGPFGWESEDVRSMLNQSGPKVRYLGYVPEPDLPALVAGAHALVYPSFYEGFGLPVAQAMAAGTPVIASNRSCLPEIVADGGLLVNPDSVDELSAAIEQLCSSPGLAVELTTRAKARAQSFRWPAGAVESLDFFHEVRGGRAG